MLTCRIALKPNKEQEEYFEKCCMVAKIVYNYTLDMKKNHLELGEYAIRNVINVLKYQDEDLKSLCEVDSAIISRAVADACSAFRKTREPRYKTDKERVSFAVNRIRAVDSKHVKISKLNEPIKTYEEVVTADKNMNIRIKYDGKYWYLTYAFAINAQNIKIPMLAKKFNTYKYIRDKEYSEEIGIDLGVKNTAILSNNIVYENINNTPKVMKLEKRLKRLKHNLKQKKQYNEESNNIRKLEAEIEKTSRKLKNIRSNYNNNMTTEIIKTKPKRIVIEDLRVSEMTSNRYLYSLIRKQKLYEIRKQFEYKSCLFQIELEKAERYFPSSKMCCRCGNIKYDLSLSDRVYKCKHCGLIIDRDLNSSINLKNYNRKAEQ